MAWKHAGQGTAAGPASVPEAMSETWDPAWRMKGDLGAYPMTRDASGTAWQPDSSPMEGVARRCRRLVDHAPRLDAGVYDDQGGPRGDDKTFEGSMLMGMAQRPLGGGTLTLRAMLASTRSWESPAIRCCSQPARPRTAARR